MEGETSTNKFSINNVRTIETSNGMLSYPFGIPKVNTYEKLSIEGKAKYDAKKHKNDGYILLYWFLN